MKANLNMHETQASTDAKSLGAKRAIVSKVKSPEFNIILRSVEKSGLAFPQFSRHSIMSKLDWSGRNEENKIYG